MLDSEDELVIYIDGSAITNPGEMVGCAMLVVYPKFLNLPNREIKFPYSGGTSGAMELQALVNALKWINRNTKEISQLGITSITVLSDSRYVVDSANSSVYRWAKPFGKDKWKTRDGYDVKHQGLWKDYLREKKKIRFGFNLHWVEGKSTEETRIVDRSAKKAAKSVSKLVNFNLNPYKQGNFLLGRGSQFIPFTEVGQRHLIRIGSHAPLGKRRDSDYEVRFEVIKEKTIEGKYKAATSQEIGHGIIDRGNYYYVTFSDDTKPPRIIDAKKIEEPELSSVKALVSLIQKS
ncbi:MAG: hypothetical protein IPJ68_04440 [Candidatus Moraniibacteriota bacterium]|nr:MAG: hypothetical protein IPJ68_04440 [Candidatus Moranbacteria bacterium]